MDYLEYKGYKGTVEYSKEDNSLFGRVVGMNKHTIIYEGNSVDELIADFREGIDTYLEDCASLGIRPIRPFSGRLNLRMSPEVHSRVVAMSSSLGTSINEFINRAIINELNHAL